MRSLAERVLFLDPSVEHLSGFRNEIRKFLAEEGSSILRNRIIFCMDELVSNIIEHGNLNSRKQKIEIRLLSFPTFWKMVIVDDALAFDPNHAIGPTLESLYDSGAEGGFGLSALKKLTRLYYKRISLENKNQVTLFFRKGNHE
ncbi:ATP-binding protein [Leptospira ognonensis]|uniref:ATP-binding protein n=1 Tax=Leptospira ognonensis TaxID=2484945 RepID=A0A4R9JWH9_9LEPT|nr:ATP-binding protein [Leptospira ognonensis]TGL56701.1 ATP-binding protein [Leptospira ognonensis]